MTINLRPINDLINKLNGAPLARITPPGFFFRVEDFSNSYHRLIKQYYAELEVADRLLGKGLASDVLQAKLRATRLRIHGSSHSSTDRDTFDTYDLSPMLRHLINDTCRILEPLTPILAIKRGINVQSGYDAVGVAKYKSFDGLIKELVRQGITSGLQDDGFFLALYEELWNEYKHVQSAGISATAWNGQNGSLTKPILWGERIKTYPNSRFRGMAVDKFMDEAILNLSDIASVVL